MTTKMRSHRNFRNPIGCLILLAALGAVAGCSTAESPTGSGTNMNHVLPSGSSVSGWLVLPSGGSHASTATQDYIANGGSSGCTQCHGSDLSGGISNVSCFGNPAGCHHSPVANWATPAGHGATAKKAPGSSGFASCQICHAANFTGGGANVTCFNANCHGPNATWPHAPPPWRNPVGSTHTNTDQGNAPVCAQCHHLNPGTPGCFNSTLCHGAAGGHPAGWVATSPATQPHGVSAKATPGTAAGFAYCQTCHGTGTNFSGGTSGISCYTCHVPTANSPHASQWRTGDTYVHTTTATGNATVCAYCHLNGANSPIAPPPAPAPGATPDCFNNTLCHNGGTGAPHPVPFNTTAHFSVDNTTFTANCGSCHAVTGTSPVPGAPLCTTCHVAASPLTSLNCTSCHANPPNSGAPAGAAYPNIAGAHSTHIALNSAGTPISCDTCHSGLGTGTPEHYNLAKARVDPGDAAFSAGFLYTGITGTAVTFDNALATLSCSNVSCHGAQGTPNWRTGTTVCTSCHTSATVAPASYNDYTQSFITHNQHIGRTGCATCHTALPASTHFGTLSDKAIASRAAAATINPAFAYPSPPPASLSMSNCNTNSVGGCH